MRVILITWLFLFLMICLDKKIRQQWEPEGEQSEKPCEQEEKQSESLNEGEGEQSKQPSERETTDETFNLLAGGKLAFGKHYFCSLGR